MNRKIVGIDEVGRGCGSGPLMACAFIFLSDYNNPELTDSKAISAKKRTLLFEELSALRKENKADWAIASYLPRAIDELGIQKCNIEAMRTAAKNLIHYCLDMDIDDIVADGTLPLGRIEISEKIYKIKSIVKADAKFPAVSAASIVAKVLRDSYMDELDKSFPDYYWKNNKGYLTSDHCIAIQKHGLTEHHRTSFCKKFATKQHGT